MKVKSAFALGLSSGFTMAALLKRWRNEKRREGRMMGFGNHAAWIWFNTEFPIFVERLTNLHALRDKMFVRRIVPRHHVDYIIYGLGRVCTEDFEQALNLCGNGFGIGAMQILRGMYERQVTAAYLATHQDEVDDFVNYHHVQLRRAVNHLRELYRRDREIFNRLVPEEEVSRIEASFEALPNKFKERCETCRKPLMMAWTPLGTPALARHGGQGLDQLYYYQYFRPTEFTHSTFRSVEARVANRPDGSFSFESDGQQSHVREALVGIHNLLLNVFDLQNKHFQLGLDTELDQCRRDYLEGWAPEELANLTRDAVRLGSR